MRIHINHIEERAHSASTAGVLWVPSEQVVVRRIPKPTAPRRKWLEMIPWLLEDQLLQSVEELHFVIVEQDDDSTLEVLIVSKQALKHWLHLAANANMRNFVVLPDFLTLPWRKGSISVAQRDDLLLVRDGYCSGFAIPAELAWVLIANLLKESDEKLELRISIPEADVPKEISADIHFLAIEEKPPLDKKIISSANLLTGEFYQRPGTASIMRQLTGAAAVVLVLIFSFAYFNYSNQRLLTQFDELKEDKTKLFSSLFPDVRSSTEDVRVDVEQLLEQKFKQRESLQVLTMNLMSQLDRIISRCECDVRSVQLNQQGGELLLTINGVASNLSNITIPGFDVSTIAGSESTQLQLVIKRGEL